MQAQPSELTLGPVLFNWEPERWRDFYFRIADEAPVATVYLGEVICFKRAPLFDDYLDAVAARLKAAGKTVVRSTLAEVMSKQERKMIDDVCAEPTAWWKPTTAPLCCACADGRITPAPSSMSTMSARWRCSPRGGVVQCLPAAGNAGDRHPRALPRKRPSSASRIEVQVFGRFGLALSARCYHARAHGRTKDSCQFICNVDPDGMTLRTLEDKPFLTVNGIQTMSHDYLNLAGELADLQDMGVTRFRLSPHSCDMVEVATIFRDALDRRIDAREAAARLDGLKIDAPFSNGFYYGKPGHRWSQAAAP